MENNFKNGDIVKIKFRMSQPSICVFDKIAETYGRARVYLYAEMALDDEEMLFAPECSISHDIECIEISMASDDEKRSLYNALYKDYTEMHQPDWLAYFTDSTCFEILDYLLYMFGIPEVDDDGDISEYPEFVYEIRNNIWDECEKTADALGGCTSKTSDDKVSLSEVCEWLNETIDEDVMVKCGSVLKLHTKEKFVEMLRLKFSKEKN